ncbi:hypothetical protein C8R47DRAFT_1105166 [Mycena vitilis]|nr:hypothetical protein C8R47DRAFT_1105166 [Mycena vitilis]
MRPGLLCSVVCVLLLALGDFWCGRVGYRGRAGEWGGAIRIAAAYIAYSRRFGGGQSCAQALAHAHQSVGEQWARDPASRSFVFAFLTPGEE